MSEERVIMRHCRRCGRDFEKTHECPLPPKSTVEVCKCANPRNMGWMDTSMQNFCGNCNKAMGKASQQAGDK